MTEHRAFKPIWTCATILMAGLASAGTAQFAGGTGEPNAPYQIATCEQLIALGNDPNLWDKHFVLTSDLDMKDVDPNTMHPIGNSEECPFVGVFDGVGHTITSLCLEPEYGVCVGLFGCVGGVAGPSDQHKVARACVRNLHLKDVRVQYKGSSVGGLAGMLLAGTISNCSVTGVVMGGDMICDTGGLLGYSLGKITRCTTDVSVQGGPRVGGLIGDMVGGEVTYCSSSGGVQGVAFVGGLVGAIEFSEYPTGLHKNKPEQIGHPGAVLCCRSDCSVIGTEDMIGGLAGSVFGDGKIEDCYALGPVSGSAQVGGLIGELWGSCVTRCYASGRVLGGEDTGGLVGKREYPKDPGELGRHPQGQIIVEKIAPAGATSSKNDEGPKWRVVFRPAIISCFWDVESSRITRGLGSGADAQGGIGRLTTVEMRKASTFRNFGWDFDDVWTIREGQDYPRLRWEQAATRKGD